MFGEPTKVFRNSHEFSKSPTLVLEIPQNLRVAALTKCVGVPPLAEVCLSILQDMRDEICKSGAFCACCFCGIPLDQSMLGQSQCAVGIGSKRCKPLPTDLCI